MTSTSKDYVQLSTKQDDDKETEPNKDQIMETALDGRKTPSPVPSEEKEKEKKNEESELVRAARFGRISAISDALNGEDELEPECLLEATKGGHMKIVSIILDSKKLNGSVKDSSGNSLLHLAAISDNLKLLDYLLEEKEDELDVNQKNELEQTPLIVAVKHEKINSTKFLLSKDPEIDVVDQDGFSAFAYACCSGNELICNLLLKAGCDPSARYKLKLYDNLILELIGDVKEKSDEEEQGSDGSLGYSPLFLSAWNGNYEAMLVLLKQLDQSAIESQIFEPQAQGLNAIETIMLSGKDDMLAHLLCTIPNDLLQEHLTTRNFKGITLAHCLYNLKCYQTLKLVLDKQVDQKQGSKKVQLHPGILESQDLPGFHWTMIAPTLLNRISADKPPELVNHPLLKAYVDGKFPVYSFYPWCCLLYYLIFLFFLTFTVIHRAYAPNATDFNSAGNLFRLVCQIILILMIIGYILVAVTEYIICSYSTYYELERKETWLRINKGFRFCCPGICFKFGKAIRAFFRKLKNILKSLFVYYYDIRNVIDVLGSLSVILLIPFWAFNIQAQFILASIVLFLNYLRFFKATMYFSCHGRYTNGILKLFTGQYLKFVFILFVIMLGFYAAIFPSLMFEQSSETMFDFLETNSQSSIFTILDQMLLAVPNLGPISAKFIILLIIASLAFFAWLLLVAVLNAQFVHAYTEAFGLPHQYKMHVITHIERRSTVSILSFMRRRVLKQFEVISIPFYYWDNYLAEDQCSMQGRDKHESLSSQIEDSLNAGVYALDKRFEVLRAMLEHIAENQNETNKRVEDVHREVIIVNHKVSQVGGLDLQDEMDRVVVEVRKVTTGHVRIEEQVDGLIKKVNRLEADLAQKLNEVQSEQRKHKLEITEKLNNLSSSDKDKDASAAVRRIDTLSAQSQANHNETDRQLKEINSGVKRVEGEERQNTQTTGKIMSVESDISQRIAKMEKAINLIVDKLNKD